MARKTKSQWTALVNEHKSGKSINDILAENPDIKKSTFSYHLKKAQEIPRDVEKVESSKPKTTVVVTKKETPEPEPEPVAPAPVAPVVDTFLDAFNPPMQEKPINYGNSGGGLVDNLFDVNDIFTPEELTKPVAKPEPKKQTAPAGKSKSWWLSKTKDKTPKEKQLEEDDEQLCLVQKIRLYFVHFPELAQLHIVPKKKNGEPDVEKFLISLYTKKTADLEKTLNFVRFHTRNTLNENSSIKLASNVLETGMRIIETTMCFVGIKSQGLTKEVMKDGDIIRCIKEILIDNSITSINVGPKTDLAMKIGMKIIQTDSSNRIEEQMAATAAKKPKQAAPNEPKQGTPSPSNEQTLAEKYNDL